MKDTLTKSEVKWWMAIVIGAVSAVSGIALSYGVFLATTNTKLDQISDNIKEMKQTQKEEATTQTNRWLVIESRLGTVIKDVASLMAIHPQLK